MLVTNGGAQPLARRVRCLLLGVALLGVLVVVLHTEDPTAGTDTESQGVVLEGDAELTVNSGNGLSSKVAALQAATKRALRAVMPSLVPPTGASLGHAVQSSQAQDLIEAEKGSVLTQKEVVLLEQNCLRVQAYAIVAADKIAQSTGRSISSLREFLLGLANT